MKCFIMAVTLFVGLLMLFGHSASTKTVTQKPDSKQEPTNRLAQVLRQEMPPEEEVAGRDALAQSQSDAALELIKLGQSDLVWPLFRVSADNTRRSYLVDRLGRAGIDPGLIIRHLDVEKDVSVRRALILSLGQFTSEQISVTRRQTLVTTLIRWYRDDPDPGIHAAIDWLVRYGREGNIPRSLDWGQSQILSAIDRQLAGRPAAKRDWYVTTEGQTMIILRGPREFRMGSPSYESGRVSASDSPDEPLRRVRILRSFATASKEVTRAQFQRFLDANANLKAKFAYSDDANRMARVLQTFSPDPDGPQIAMTWYEAAMYCNWLSKQEGIPESEWVYPTSVDQIRDGMTMPENYLHSIGYRLPTEAEWEYAVRAGSTTSRFFGTSEAMLKNYAWYSKNPPKHKGDASDPNDPQRTWPVGQLKPNDFGLFDIYGNVWEWCQDRMREYPSDNTVHEDSEDELLLVSDKVARSRRGGAFPYEAAMQRSAGRGTKNAFPILRRDNVGFRVVRTIR